MTHPLILPELLENIFSFLAKDKALYPTLFVNHLWYQCGAPILWHRVEFFNKDYHQSRRALNMSRALTRRLINFKKVMRGKIKPLYCSKMAYLRLESLKISDAFITAILHSCPNIRFLILDKSKGFSNIPIIEIARCCPKLLHLSLDACKAITDRCISEIVRSCPKLEYVCLDSSRSLNITGVSVIEIVQFCPNLIYLNLSCQYRIKDVSFCAITCSCIKLQHLDLSFNYYITDDAVCGIVRSCPNIQYLILHSTDITDKTIYDIAHYCSNLLVLNVGDCRSISKESIHFLSSKKPTLDIILDT
ncbi:hypothetical protein Glove_26g313 [Diversispora epigaea]|uniref:F-box domain-containing protein n=1 Tax=Diversispora epigaea TaxID=1348612 RepID=A0A397JL71_9GLOM|nr:hypothetical protein Glove_26g313 [Diversispora epigaea]